MVRDCRPDDIGVSVSYPLPGTPFYERVKAQLGDKQNWIDSNDLAMMYRATYAPEFYRTLHGAGARRVPGAQGRRRAAPVAQRRLAAARPRRARGALRRPAAAARDVGSSGCAAAPPCALQPAPPRSAAGGRDRRASSAQ